MLAQTIGVSLSVPAVGICDDAAEKSVPMIKRRVRTIRPSIGMAKKANTCADTREPTSAIDWLRTFATTLPSDGFCRERASSRARFEGFSGSSSDRRRRPGEQITSEPTSDGMQQGGRTGCCADCGDGHDSKIARDQGPQSVPVVLEASVDVLLLRHSHLVSIASPSHTTPSGRCARLIGMIRVV